MKATTRVDKAMSNKGDIVPPVTSRDLKALDEEAYTTSLSLESVTEPCEESIQFKAKFIDDISNFAASFTPTASAELLIGAYSDLFGKLKSIEAKLSQNSEFIIPGVENLLFSYLQHLMVC